MEKYLSRFFSSWRNIFLVYCFIFLVFSFQFWALKRVVFSYDFWDYRLLVVPEICSSLNFKNGFFLQLWQPTVEMGKQVLAPCGFNVLHPIVWLLMVMFNDPYTITTLLFFSYTFFIGVFTIWFCKENGLCPLAGLISGAGLAFSPMIMFTHSFPMFYAGVCWVMGILFSVKRLQRKGDFLGWAVLVMSIHGTALMGYPQFSVYFFWISFAYVIYCFIGAERKSKFFLLLLSSSIVGVFISLPYLIDVYNYAVISGRTSGIVILCLVTNVSDFIFRQILSVTKNGTHEPLEISPYSTLPIVCVFVFFGSMSIKKTFLYWFLFFATCAFYFFIPIRLFMSTYMGMCISTWFPTICFPIFYSVISAYGVDAFISAENFERKHAITYLLFVILTIVGCFYLYGIGGVFDPIKITIICFFSLLFFLSLFKKYRIAFVMSAFIVCITGISIPELNLFKKSELIKNDFINKLRKKVNKGSLYDERFLNTSLIIIPNQWASFGIGTVHTYNSMATLSQYRSFAKAMNEQDPFHLMRHSLSPDYDSTIFWMSDIGVVLSKQELSHGALSYLGKINDVFLYKNNERMGRSIQTSQYEIINGNALVQDPRRNGYRAVQKTHDHGDILEYKMGASGKESLLVLSQQYNKYWRAYAGGKQVDTCPVNGVFQGVRVPPRTGEVTLKFCPWSRYAYIGHIFFFGAILVLIYTIIKRRLS